MSSVDGGAQILPTGTLSRESLRRTLNGSSPKEVETKTLRGIDAVVAWYSEPEHKAGPENLDVSEERGELEVLGGGRVAGISKLVYRWKESGEVAYVRSGRLVYTIRDGKIVRYEREAVPDEKDAGTPAH
jgi:hypothetical protein